jgi:hypothetical protein
MKGLDTKWLSADQLDDWQCCVALWLSAQT